jgi:hypothetical protein
MKQGQFIVDGLNHIAADQDEKSGTQQGAEHHQGFSHFQGEQVEKGHHAQLGPALEGDARADHRHPYEQVDGDLFGGTDGKVNEIAAQDVDKGNQGHGHEQNRGNPVVQANRFFRSQA